jgi:UDP-N-acetylglucosamine:LPS N-acetylglucosamine transferase
MNRYVREEGILRAIPLCSYSAYTDLMRNCAAIISKPGGATLNDSLSYGIPFVMLEPFGDHELQNSNYWEACGFGIQFAEWKAMDYSGQHLEEIYRRLLEQRSKINHLGRKTHAAENSSYV